MWRTIPTTSYWTRQGKDYMILEALGRILLESWDWAILLERSINSLYSARTTVNTSYN